jgi:hypothetical protein
MLPDPNTVQMVDAQRRRSNPKPVLTWKTPNTCCEKGLMKQQKTR